MSRCARIPYLRIYTVPADPAEVEIDLPADLVTFVIRPRTAVGMKLRLDPAAIAYFSIDAGESLSVDNLKIDEEPVKLLLSAASEITVELFGWRG